MHLTICILNNIHTVQTNISYLSCDHLLSQLRENANVSLNSFMTDAAKNHKSVVQSIQTG